MNLILIYHPNQSSLHSSPWRNKEGERPYSHKFSNLGRDYWSIYFFHFWGTWENLFYSLCVISIRKVVSFFISLFFKLYVVDIFLNKDWYFFYPLIYFDIIIIYWNKLFFYFHIIFSLLYMCVCRDYNTFFISL